MILLDTNVLCRIANRNAPQRAVAVHALETLRQRNETLAIVPQCIYEFWVVATRGTEHNGLGMTPALASQWLQYFQRHCQLLPAPPTFSADLATPHDAVRSHQLSGP